MAQEKKDHIIGGCFDYARLHKQTALPLICIYDHPADYPDSFVARVWDASKPTHLVAIADTLEDIRTTIPPNMTRIPRHAKDDPTIVEVWI